jgi:hypothetical protein
MRLTSDNRLRDDGRGAQLMDSTKAAVGTLGAIGLAIAHFVFGLGDDLFRNKRVIQEGVEVATTHVDDGRVISRPPPSSVIAPASEALSMASSVRQRASEATESIGQALIGNCHERVSLPAATSAARDALCKAASDHLRNDMKGDLGAYIAHELSRFSDRNACSLEHQAMLKALGDAATSVSGWPPSRDNLHVLATTVCSQFGILR